MHLPTLTVSIGRCHVPSIKMVALRLGARTSPRAKICGERSLLRSRLPILSLGRALGQDVIVSQRRGQEGIGGRSPLQSSDYYRDRRIDLLLHSRVSSLDTKRRQIVLENGKGLEFGALLLATGADPVRLPIEGVTDSQLHYLRTFADSKAIIAKAASAKHIG
jgi:NADPH-dependent 2,4-dienoyl-CoA reductase/sulfur reductase-like enzyme